MKVTLLMAITLDGKIARDDNHFPDWTEKADKQFFMQYTQKAGCIIMGSKTFATIGRPLPKRKNIVMTRKKILHSPEENLEFTNKTPQDILKGLENSGLKEVVIAGGAEINTLWMKQNLIDQIILTISPLIFGTGISLFSDSVHLNLELIEMKTLSDHLICVRYKVI